MPPSSATLPLPSSPLLADAVASPTFTSTIDNGTKIILVPPPNPWASWTPTQRNGVIAASVISILSILALITGVCWLQRKRKKIAQSRRQRGRSRSGGSQGGAGGGGSRRSSRSRIRELAEQVGKERGKKKGKGKEKGARGLGDVELGPVGGRERDFNDFGYGYSAGMEGVGGGGMERMNHGGGGNYEMSGALQGIGRGVGREFGRERSQERGWVRVVGTRDGPGRSVAEYGGGD